MKYLEKGLMGILEMDKNQCLQLIDRAKDAARKNNGVVGVYTVFRDEDGQYDVHVIPDFTIENLGYTAAKFVRQLLKDILRDKRFKVL